jgi:hypothetical protein
MLELNDLPPQIVPAVEAFASRLSMHVRRSRDASLEVHEQGVLDAWRAASGAILGGVVSAATTGADPQARPPRSACPRCGRGCPALRWRPRSVDTRLGGLVFSRTRYRCRPCCQTWSAADRTLGLAPRQRTSAGLAAWEADVAGRTTFREAAELLAKLAGVRVGSETLRGHAERVGTELEGQQQRAVAHVQATQEPLPESPREPAPGVLVVEADGVLVRYRDLGRDGSPWHEVKLGIVGGWMGTRPDAHLEAPSYVAAREKAAPFARRLGAEAARRGSLAVVGWRGHAADGGGHEAILRPVVVIGDGAKWIWDEVAASFGGERTEIVDWWHAAEHIWDLSKALHGQGTPQADTWADHAKHVLWRHGPVPLLRLLRETVAPNADACKILQRERGYFSANALRMQYPLFRQQGLPVGSGAVESGAKHLVQQRMKRAGMRWSELGARAILHLRCQTLSATTPDRAAS